MPVMPMIEGQFALPPEEADDQQDLLFDMIQKRQLQIDIESAKKSFTSRLKEEASPQ